MTLNIRIFASNYHESSINNPWYHDIPLDIPMKSSKDSHLWHHEYHSSFPLNNPRDHHGKIVPHQKLGIFSGFTIDWWYHLCGFPLNNPPYITMSMGWLKRISTGNHRFSHEILDFPAIFPLNQSIDHGIPWMVSQNRLRCCRDDEPFLEAAKRLLASFDERKAANGGHLGQPCLVS